MVAALSPKAPLDPTSDLPVVNGAHGPDVPPTEAPAGGRDSRGRFTKGNRGGPGNPFARQTAGLRAALLAAVTEQDMQEVAAALLLRARLGNLVAIKLLFSYVIGRPVDPVDPDTLDRDEWRLFNQAPVPGEEVTAVLRGLPPDVACTLVRAAWPAVGEGLARMLSQGLRDGVPSAAKGGDGPPASEANGAGGASAAVEVPAQSPAVSERVKPDVRESSQRGPHRGEQGVEEGQPGRVHRQQTDGNGAGDPKGRSAGKDGPSGQRPVKGTAGAGRQPPGGSSVPRPPSANGGGQGHAARPSDASEKRR
jgi:hypothetical protein